MVVWWIVLLWSEIDLAADIQHKTPPFVAQGTIVSQVFTPNGVTPIRRSEGAFYFLSSNAFWQLDVTYTGPAAMAGCRISCKSIPEGIRFFTTFPPSPKVEKATVLAHSIRQEFPPAEQPFLLACWLALTPKPSLPMLGAGQMRRFLFQEHMTHPENRGSFTANFLPPDDEFLSALSITNNGLLFQMGAQPIRFKGPYAAGFLETQYELLGTTNLGGAVFPLRGAFRRLGPRQVSTEPEVFTASEDTVIVSTIQILGGASAVTPPPESPSRLLAVDSRPPGLPKDLSMNHIVTNDEWVSVTNPELLDLAKIYKNMRQRRARIHVGYIALFLGLAVVAPAAALVIGKRRNKRT